MNTTVICTDFLAADLAQMLPEGIEIMEGDERLIEGQVGTYVDYRLVISHIEHLGTEPCKPCDLPEVKRKDWQPHRHRGGHKANTRRARRGRR